VSTTLRRPWSGEELGRLPPPWRYEIDQGELVIMAPAGFDHGDRTNWIAHILTGFVEQHRLGKVLSGEVGVYLHRDPDTLRGLDVAFYSQERLVRIKDRQGFPDVPPDLAVEVHLPDEHDMQRKVRQYLDAGVRSVWVVDPRGQVLTQHRPGEPPLVIAGKDDIVQEPVLPGFRCRLKDLFGAE
jgi:Uma2 family endonuclease